MSVWLNGYIATLKITPPDVGTNVHIDGAADALYLVGLLNQELDHLNGRMIDAFVNVQSHVAPGVLLP